MKDQVMLALLVKGAVSAAMNLIELGTPGSGLRQFCNIIY